MDANKPSQSSLSKKKAKNVKKNIKKETKCR